MLCFLVIFVIIIDARSSVKAAGTALPSFASDLLIFMENEGGSEGLVRDVCGSLYGGM